jgi:hypothetical protein
VSDLLILRGCLVLRNRGFSPKEQLIALDSIDVLRSYGDVQVPRHRCRWYEYACETTPYLLYISRRDFRYKPRDLRDLVIDQDLQWARGLNSGQPFGRNLPPIRTVSGEVDPLRLWLFTRETALRSGISTTAASLEVKSVIVDCGDCGRQDRFRLELYRLAEEGDPGPN